MRARDDDGWNAAQLRSSALDRTESIYCAYKKKMPDVSRITSCSTNPEHYIYIPRDRLIDCDPASPNRTGTDGGQTGL